MGLLWTDNEVQSPQACRHDGLSLSVLSTTPPTQPLCPPHLIPPAFASPSGPSACIYLSPGGHAHARGPSSNPICPSSCLPDPSSQDSHLPLSSRRIQYRSQGSHHHQSWRILCAVTFACGHGLEKSLGGQTQCPSDVCPTALLTEPSPSASLIRVCCNGLTKACDFPEI